MARYKRGDPGAFRTLLEGCRADLNARIRRRLPARMQRRVSVHDLLQEAEIVAFERRGDFAGRDAGDLRNWLLGIVDMKVRRALQRHEGVAKRDARREVSRSTGATTEKFVGRQASPSQEAIAGELRGLANEALSRLPPDYREVIRLVRIEGLDHEQAAERMGRTVNAIHKLHGRALLRFTQLFEELGHGRGE